MSAALVTGQFNWDVRFLRLAREIASWSKDPSTKVGAVIVRPDKTVVSLGYNGLPRSIADYPDLLHRREVKYALTVHAEMNAILSATDKVYGCTLYVWPLPPCHRCAVHLLQAGVFRTVSVMPTQEQLDRWGDSFDQAKLAQEQGGGSLYLYKPTDLDG